MSALRRGLLRAEASMAGWLSSPSFLSSSASPLVAVGESGMVKIDFFFLARKKERKEGEKTRCWAVGPSS
jgi:hypothetical protein